MSATGIVHELAHLIEANRTPAFWNEANRTPAFWNIVRAKTPTMEKARAWLKDHGQMREDEI